MKLLGNKDYPNQIWKTDSPWGVATFEINSAAQLEHCEMSKMVCFGKLINSF